MAANQMFSCPFCGYRESVEYQLLLHVEVNHSETGDSPFAIKDEPAIHDWKAEQVHSSGTSTPTQTEYVECPQKCGELVLASELQLHIDLHIAESMALDEGLTDGTNKHSRSNNRHKGHKDHSPRRHRTKNRDGQQKQRNLSWRDLLFSGHKRSRSPVQQTKSQTGNLRRLGKAELGPYANEKRMPAWLIRLLEDGGTVTASNKMTLDGKLTKIESVSNETTNLVPILARLSYLDERVSRAFFCDPQVRHIGKLPKEGGFCGYRNIQMLLSYIHGARAPGYQHFVGKGTPSILKLQDMIEHAWDKGYNEAGREETGGIRTTRKYIGTSEAQALLLSLDIAAEVVAFTSDKRGESYLAMIDAVCEYFDEASTANNLEKIVMTTKPPIYFQHQGHSMTIVGVEIDEEGKPSLMVFDPMYNTNHELKELALANNLIFTVDKPAKFLRLHRRDGKHLEKYKAFEMIKINGPV